MKKVKSLNIHYSADGMLRLYLEEYQCQEEEAAAQVSAGVVEFIDTPAE